MAAVNYPTGMNLSGDPSQALIHSTTTGNFVIPLSSTDLGQGLKTVIAQIGAEVLGVPFEKFRQWALEEHPQKGKNFQGFVTTG